MPALRRATAQTRDVPSVNDDDDEDPWETCPVCRTRPISARVSARELERRLPRGWRPLATQRPVGAWAATLPCCIECGTCWLLWHDAKAELLEATAPLPEAALPLLYPASALTEVLSLLPWRARGAPPIWVQPRVDDLLVAWFEAAPLRPGTAARGLLHAATVPELAGAERTTALQALRAVFGRARRAGESLEGDWIALLTDVRLRTSGPAVIEGLRGALDAGLAPPPVLRCDPELRAQLQTLRVPPRRDTPTTQDLAARVRKAFRAR